MEILVVFDNDFDHAALSKILTTIPSARLHLFSLTSNFILVEKVQRNLNQLDHIQTVSVDSAKLINQAVNKMQETIHDWSHQLGMINIDGQQLKEWFLYPDQQGSAWWLGLIAEKNTVQENVFFHLAQVNAIHHYLINQKIERCYVSISDKTKTKVILNSAESLAIATQSINPNPKLNLSFKKKMLNRINQNAFSAAYLNLLLWLKDSLRARLTLRHFQQRVRKALQQSLTFVSYFPNIDEEKAKTGLFINKYASALQNELQQNRIPVTWLLMPVFYNGHRFKDALRFAQQFIRHGENLFILQEFFTLKIFCKSIFWWVKQTIKSEWLLHKLSHQQLKGQLTIPAARPYLTYLWRNSFSGTSGMRGIIFYLIFRQFFRTIPNMKACLYFCEMQAWEKALIMAKQSLSQQTQTYAFQHTVIMRNFFNYFYAKGDFAQTNSNPQTALPLPDVLIANGPLPHRLFMQYAYPNLRQAEALRQLYLNQTLQMDLATAQKSVLLIIGSCDRQETRSMISLVHQAYPETKETGSGANERDTARFEIWIKASPVNPVEPLLEELEIDIKVSNFRICKEDIAQLLAQTMIAFVGNTTVAIEAAAFGCEVIIPLFADTMLMNPIIETSAHYHVVNTSLELRTVIENKLLNTAPKKMNKDIITQCWDINPTLSLWKEILIDAKVT